MVSSALDMSDDELLEALRRIRDENAEDPEYQELRSTLPAEWPI
jgi:hypothetical protein